MKNFLHKCFRQWLWIAAAGCFALCLLFLPLAGHGFLSTVLGCLGLLFSAFKLLTVYKSHTWVLWTRRVLCSLVILGLLLVIPTGVLIALDMPGDDVTCEYVVVLGAGVHGTVPSLSLRSRIDAAAAYLQKNPQVICIVSGGQGVGEDISEAQCMYRELVKAGIAPNRIWMEDRATSTQENLRFSLDLIAQRTGTRPTEINVLSNDYHLFRAKIFAEQEGVTAYGVAADSPYFTLFLNYYLREIAGVWHEIIIGGDIHA